MDGLYVTDSQPFNIQAIQSFNSSSLKKQKNKNNEHLFMFLFLQII